MKIYLHTDAEGCVWYGSASQCAINSGLTPHDFVSSDVVGSALVGVQFIRVLGCSSNAELLVELFHYRATRPRLLGSQQVRLGSPVVVPAGKLCDAEFVLRCLRQLPSHGSCVGNWHDMDKNDYCTYALINMLRRVRGTQLPEFAARVLAYHPAWPALSYVSGLDRWHACRLLCDIVDPRWYRHPFRPNRLSRLYAHLGLTMQNMRCILGQSSEDRHFYSAVSAVLAWRGQSNQSPEFLDRYSLATGDAAKTLLRGAQRFVTFVALYWLHAASFKHPETEFDSAVILGGAANGKAFDKHCRNLPKSI